jgi:hypothetical protein
MAQFDVYPAVTLKTSAKCLEKGFFGAESGSQMDVPVRKLFRIANLILRKKPFHYFRARNAY